MRNSDPEDSRLDLLRFEMSLWCRWFRLSVKSAKMQSEVRIIEALNVGSQQIAIFLLPDCSIILADCLFVTLLDRLFIAVFHKCAETWIISIACARVIQEKFVFDEPSI